MAQLPLTDEERRICRETAGALAEQLGEKETGPLIKLWRVVRVLGRDEALALLDEARAIEAKGGMLITDQSRRRTFGGVYFQLARQRLHGQPSFYYVFPAARGRNAEKPQTITAPSPVAHAVVPAHKKQPAPPTPATAPFLWTDRLPMIDVAIQDAGGASTVKVTLVGRPGKILEKDDFILTAMPTMKIPTLPKGVPIPSEQTQTQIAVFIAKKQWKKVAEAIKQPEDMLIVEGFAVYEPQIKGMAVLASNVTTKLLQLAKKQEAPVS